MLKANKGSARVRTATRVSNPRNKHNHWVPVRIAYRRNPLELTRNTSTMQTDTKDSEVGNTHHKRASAEASHPQNRSFIHSYRAAIREQCPGPLRRTLLRGCLEAKFELRNQGWRRVMSISVDVISCLWRRIVGSAFTSESVLFSDIAARGTAMYCDSIDINNLLQARIRLRQLRNNRNF
jgi:hypothetical protein